MSSNVFKKFKQNTKEVIDYVDSLQAQLEYLKTGFTNLLNEEDITQLPSYKLLQQSYMEYLNSDNVPLKKKTTEVESELYGDMYMPPKMRNKNKQLNAKIRKTISEDAKNELNPIDKFKIKTNVPKTVTSTEATQQFSTRHMPDFGESMLEDMGPAGKSAPRVAPLAVAPPKPKALAKVSTAKILNVPVSKDDVVQKVEIQGEVYLKYGTFLYDRDTHIRVGQINNSFIVNDKKHNIDTELSVQELDIGPEYKDHYISTDTTNKTVYTKVSESVLQAVGELDADGQMGLWTEFMAATN